MAKQCIWSLNGICQAYQYSTRTPLECDGRHVKCGQPNQNLIAIPTTTDEWVKRRKQLEKGLVHA